MTNRNGKARRWFAFTMDGPEGFFDTKAVLIEALRNSHDDGRTSGVRRLAGGLYQYLSPAGRGHMVHVWFSNDPEILRREGLDEDVIWQLQHGHRDA